MMTTRGLLLTAIALALPTGLAAQELEEPGGRVTPLFADDAILDVTIRGPVNDIVRKAERSTEPQAAILEANGESLPIQLSARGVSRRRKDICKFPPLKIAFGKGKPDGSLFRKQGNLKLVTHCLDKDSAQQTLLREYATYRLLNIVTPISFKVRLLRVSYVDDGKEVANEYGFFIEDADDAARRVGLKEVDVGIIPPRVLNVENAARIALFQYMIGNLDWAMIGGPDPKDCCHNTKLVGAAKDARADLTPMPYDFDHAGLVDAPYAEPNSVFKMRNIQQRLYRGFCIFNDRIPAEAARFRELRPAFEAEIAAIPSLDGKAQSQMTRYLDSFFDDIADQQTLEKELLKDCR